MSTSKHLLYYSNKDKVTIVTKWDYFFWGKKFIGHKQDFVNFLMDVYLFNLLTSQIWKKKKKKRLVGLRD